MLLIVGSFLKDARRYLAAPQDETEEDNVFGRESCREAHMIEEEDFAAAKSSIRSPLRHHVGTRQPSCREAHMIEKDFTDEEIDAIICQWEKNYGE